MDPFEIMKLRGQVLGSGEGPRVRRLSRGEDNSGTSTRRGTYTQEDRMSVHDTRVPLDLMRSRRVGLSRTVCVDCGAVKDEGRCHHHEGCKTPNAWRRETTGPLNADETSADSGWS